ncbi:FAD binding domain-containing protein [Oceanispirochaeta sp.]|jgi:xanthine dehydrogenase FAD-binding subunit|uniref:FAD binding domain-containing protein n=1 Tax=Oceanispirochaeta sp. TaxID=2035350 RepID=UPI002604750C|nr:FAD binding domain-containing protein [Oceanispirochaeta sp.]MDA3956077.1 FAD binding domain-containing protein [Oceanispirochaeta sp.]
MVKFFYPESLSEALDIKNSKKVLPLAGGTDLMVRYENWSSLPADFPSSVMTIGHLKELQFVTEEKGYLCIGGGVTLNQLLNDSRIPRSLALSLDEIAAPALRNLATLAGNIQNASPAADSLPPLIVANASLRLISKNGSRKMTVRDFVTGPGKTSLNENELIESVRIPLDFIRSEEKGHLIYRKVGTRKANALSKLSACFWVLKDRGVIKDIRMSLGAVAAVVVRLEESEEKLTGLKSGELLSAWKDVRGDYEKAVRPIDDQRSTAVYRKRTALKLMDAFIQEASED